MSNTDFIYHSEDKLVEAINEECQLVPYGDEMRLVFVEKNVPVFRRRRDAELKLAKYQLFLLHNEGKKNEKGELKPGFPIWVKSALRKEFARLVFKPNVNEVDLTLCYVMPLSIMEIMEEHRQLLGFSFPGSLSPQSGNPETRNGFPCPFPGC